MEDEKIVMLYWQRSEDAIKETDAKYGRFCYSVAFNILHSCEDSEECVNDTYSSAWNAIPQKSRRGFNTFSPALPETQQ